MDLDIRAGHRSTSLTNSFNLIEFVQWWWQRWWSWLCISSFMFLFSSKTILNTSYEQHHIQTLSKTNTNTLCKSWNSFWWFEIVSVDPIFVMFCCVFFCRRLWLYKFLVSDKMLSWNLYIHCWSTATKTNNNDNRTR